MESSCDETSCAVVADGGRVLSNVVASQIELHARFGGVVPELASRAHIEAVNTVLGQALDQAGVARGDIAAVAVTCEPGLIGSLLVGLMAAKTIAWVLDVPLVGVNHVYAHAYAPALNAEPIEYPAAALVCSGGHTALYRCQSPIELHLLGTTIDDAAGEAFDKVAHILRLGFPGGPVIDKVARGGNPAAVHFPRSLLAGQSLDFSFSGLKTAVLYHVNGVPGSVRKKAEPEDRAAEPAPGPQGMQSQSAQSCEEASRPASGRPSGDGGASREETHPREETRAREESHPRDETPPRHETHLREETHPRGIENLSPQEVADIAASFQAAVVDVLRTKLRRAAKLTGAKTLIIGGGVAANSALRAAAADLAKKLRCTLRMPEMKFCVDNAAMIAGLGYRYLRAGRVADLDLEAHATVKR